MEETERCAAASGEWCAAVSLSVSACCESPRRRMTTRNALVRATILLKSLPVACAPRSANLLLRAAWAWAGGVVAELSMSWRSVWRRPQ